MTLLFASDSRLAPAEVGRVASGGELSRLVLALRLAGGAGGSATFAFDEIDAGVGGVTAIALGRKLKSLAVEHQVLCVTHLPQVAAHADTHFAVEREGNTAVLRRLEGEERRIELARMLAGMPESERGKEAADELLTLARAR
jgi:DNA repair protein RecN (Recombination protein N)